MHACTCGGSKKLKKLSTFSVFICGLASGLAPFLGFFFITLTVTSLPAQRRAHTYTHIHTYITHMHIQAYNSMRVACMHHSVEARLHSCDRLTMRDISLAPISARRMHSLACNVPSLLAGIKC